MNAVLNTLRVVAASALLAGVASAQPVALVRQADSDGSYSVGSGTLIAKDESHAAWLTARHVVSGGGQVTVQPHGERAVYVATSVERHPSLDLAILLTSSRDLTLEPAPIGDVGDLSTGRALISGYAWGSTYQGRPGSWASYDATRSEGIWRGQAISGQSGGPIYSPDRRAIMGVVSGSDGDITVGPHCGPIRRWLSTLGWRIRRARSQAIQYTQLSCGPDGRVGFDYPQRPDDFGSIDEPPPADLNRPHTPAVGGIPKPVPASQGDIGERLDRLEKIVARLPTRAEVSEQVATVGTQPLIENERIDAIEQNAGVQGQQINELTDAMARLADASTSLNSQVGSLTEELGNVVRDLKKLSDDVAKLDRSGESFSDILQKHSIQFRRIN